MRTLVIILAIVIIIIVLAVGAFYIWIRIPPKNKVEVYKKKVMKAEKKKGSPLTKDEKEEIAKEVDKIDASEGPHLDIDSVDWRFDVDDEDVTSELMTLYMRKDTCNKSK